MATDTHTRTDGELLQEILDLIDGTHWMQGELGHACYIPLPEGVSEEEWRKEFPKIETRTVEIVSEGTEDPQIPLTLKNRQEAVDYGYEPTKFEEKRCYLKMKYCLVGMVLKVLGVDKSDGDAFDERSIQLNTQGARIIDLLFVQLPKKYHSKHKDQLEETVRHGDKRRTFESEEAREAHWATAELSSKISYLEGWNDERGSDIFGITDTAKQDVRDLVERARDAANNSQEA